MDAQSLQSHAEMERSYLAMVGTARRRSSSTMRIIECMVRGTVVLMSAALAACSQEVSAPPSGSSPPPTLPSQPFELSLGFQPYDERSDALGSLFTFRSHDGDVICGAGFVASVGTRAYSNQNELEFWCREGTGPELEWELQGRAAEGVMTTALINHRGRLLDVVAGRYKDFATGDWVEYSNEELDAVRGATPYVWHSDGPGDWIIATALFDCPGLSYFSSDGYHGTFVTGDSFSAAVVWNDVAFASFDGAVWKAQLPAPSEEGCQVLEPELVVGDPISTYGLFAVGSSLFIGGGGLPFVEASDSDCAPIYVYDGIDALRIEIDGCGPGQITEIYGFALYDDALFAGTYPDGRLVRIDLTTLDAVLTDIPAATPGYSESQAMAVAAGRLLIGQFPWGEVHEPVTGNVYRLFPAPARSDSDRPFDDEAGHDWSQRVTSIAVLDGRVCAGTGNTFAVPYDPDAHAFLDPQLAEEYGRAHCADLSNQVLTPLGLAGATMTFQVTASELIIQRDGVAVVRRQHDLSAAAVAAIAGGGITTIGQGPYGPAQAQLTTR